MALVRDLIFASRIQAEARAAACSLRVVRDAQQLADLQTPAQLLLVDLGQDQALAAAARWKNDAPGRRAIGFVSHVDTELIQRARSAGLDEVLPRSRFVGRLPQLMAGAD